MKSIVQTTTEPDVSRRLGKARVLIVGMGGLGSPAALYLASSGVGTIGLADPDVVDLSNLQRQIIHTTGGVGRPKVETARERLLDLAPSISVPVHPVRLTAANARSILDGYEVVIDGTDTIESKFEVNDAAVAAGIPLVHGGILRFEGLVLSVDPGRSCCYRCLFEGPPPIGSVPSCAEAGVIGALAGIVGTIQALEALKIVLGVGHPLYGRLLRINALSGAYRVVEVEPNPECPACRGIEAGESRYAACGPVC